MELSAVINGAESEPVYEVVLLQVAAATGDVSGHSQQVPHGERGRLALHVAQPSSVHSTKTQTHAAAAAQTGVVQTYSSWPVQSQKALHVSSGHQLQQDEPWQDVQTDSDAAHNVVVAKLAVDK